MAKFLWCRKLLRLGLAPTSYMYGFSVSNYVVLDVQPLLRFPRFIKLYRLVQFLYLAENQATFPNVLRVCNLTHILLLLCHWFAAFYYMISKVQLITYLVLGV